MAGWLRTSISRSQLTACESSGIHGGERGCRPCPRGRLSGLPANSHFWRCDGRQWRTRVLDTSEMGAFLRRVDALRDGIQKDVLKLPTRLCPREKGRAGSLGATSHQVKVGKQCTRSRHPRKQSRDGAERALSLRRCVRRGGMADVSACNFLPRRSQARQCLWYMVSWRWLF